MSSRTPHSDVFSLDFLERSCGLVPSRESLFDDIEDLKLRRISPISGLVETRGNYKWGNSRLYIVTTNDRKRTVSESSLMLRGVKLLNVSESFIRNRTLPLGRN